MKNYIRITIVILVILLISLSAVLIYIKASSNNYPGKKAIKISYENAVVYVIPDKDSYLEKLEEMSRQCEDIDIIIENIDYFPEEILDLVLKNPETIDFALNYPNEYPDRDSGKAIDIKKDYEKGSIPLFLQWDRRWGYGSYGDKMIAINGCGPTSLSMVIVGLTGDIDQNPKKIADFSYERGYYVDGIGTSWTLMSEGSEQFGITAKELSLDKNAILSALGDNMPIIVSMKKGHFTTESHYIVLTGVTDEGKITVNDSNSVERSNMEWDIDVFMEEAKNLWAFSKK